MNAALEKLRERNRGTVVLDSGVEVGLQLVPMRECIKAGGIPLPLLQKVAAAENGNGKGADLSAEETEQLVAFQRTLIAASVRSVDGEEAELEPADTSAFTDEEFYELLDYVMREKPLPGKAAP
jgi:hypothetical protein